MTSKVFPGLGAVHRLDTFVRTREKSVSLLNRNLRTLGNSQNYAGSLANFISFIDGFVKSRQIADDRFAVVNIAGRAV